MIIAAGMWETSHLIHIRDFGVEIIKTFWEKTQNNPKSFIPFASSVGQDKMLARTRQYTWSQLIMNKNKQMILISSLLNPFTQFPFFIDWNTNNVNSDVFYNPFPLSVFPSYWFFSVVHEVQILAKQCQLTHAESSETPRSPLRCAGGTMMWELKWWYHFQLNHSRRRGDRPQYFCWSPSQGALSCQGHRYDRPKLDLTREDDRDVELVSSLRSFMFIADRLKRTAPQAAEMGQALVMGHHTVKRSNEGENL